MVRARRLKDKITVQQATETRDAYGEPVAMWATYAIRFADINPVSGREYFTAQQSYSENSYRFAIRYDTKTKDITPKMRISYDSRVFDIQAVLNEGTLNRDITIIATEST